MTDIELYRLTASEALTLIQTRKITVEDYARSLLSRVEARDAVVKAWAYLDPAFVLEQARKLDQVPDEDRGPLHGIAIGIKDVINTRDMPTQYNSPIYEGSQTRSDAATVGILRKAGALIFGKTTTTEFAAINKGPQTHNPHDPSRTPGGSSSGSAAAVADMQVPLSLGTQTAGSVIRPASFNGIFGMKPTWNAISPEGQKIFSLTVDTVGYFARSVDDLELLADIFAIEDDSLPLNITLRESKFAILKTPHWSRAGPGTQSALASATKLLQDNSALVEEITLPTEFDDLLKLHQTIVAGDSRVSFYREYCVAKDKLDDELVDYVDNIPRRSRQDQLRASDRMARLRPIMDEIAQKYTAIISPSVIDEAPVGIEFTGSPIFNFLWTSLHVPVVNIPGFHGPNGMPVALSAVAPRYKDRHLLKVCQELGRLFGSQGGWRSSL